eukprot:m.121946 g.121946  ORF g.121946 m.121946 type:complete len:263 (-) comp14413_c0_seq8:2082-2870(-)
METMMASTMITTVPAVTKPQSRRRSQQNEAVSTTPFVPRRNNRGMLTKAWLAMYNCMNALGWWFVLIRIAVLYLSAEGSVLGLYRLENTLQTVGHVVFALQGLVLLDLVHAALGLWGDHPTHTLAERIMCKVGHRSEVFVSVVMAAPLMPHSGLFGLLFFSWGLADIFRFPYYVTQSYGVTPRWLKWMRYSMFIIQWPIQLVAELLFVGVASCLQFLTYGVFCYAWIGLALQIRHIVIFGSGYKALLTARRVNTTTMVSCSR